MSVVIEKPQIRTRVRPGSSQSKLRTRVRVRVEPELRPYVEVPASTRAVTVQQRSSLTVAGVIACKMGLFAGVFVATFVVSGVGGQYMADRSHASSRDSLQRVSSATKLIREAQHRIDYMSTSASLEQWALTHGFHSPDGLGQTSKVDNLVATNR
jgi:hypothetical protein